MFTSEKILIVRSAMGLDEKRFGIFFRLSTKTIQDWEKGYIIPRRNELRLISRYTRISIDDFLNKEKAIELIDNKLIVKDCLAESNDTNKAFENITLEDYPHEDNPRYQERD